MALQDEIQTIVEIYEWPSQAFWRYFELLVIRNVIFDHPVLEIGCGDGRFTGLIFDIIEEAIDINPRSVQKCREVAGHLYRNVHCMDVRDLVVKDEGYATVFANCVLEHIPDLNGVLAGCLRGLRTGGRLAFTVPFKEMEDHLLIGNHWYAELRRRQLVHVNLISPEEWIVRLKAMGFQDVEIYPYLYGKECRFWDTLDVLGCLGWGKYNLANIVRFMARICLSDEMKNKILKKVSDFLSRKWEPEWHSGEVCAALIVAHKP